MIQSSYYKDEEISHVYYDLSTINNSQVPQSLVFQEIRSSSFLDTPNDYNVSVLRFNIDSASLPLMIPQVLSDGINTDCNKLVYSVSLMYENTTVQTYLNFIPQNMNFTVPAGIVQQSNSESEYYYLYSFQHFIDIVNNALYKCMTDLVATCPDLTPSKYAPFFEMNPSTNVPTLNADILGFDNNTEKSIKIFLNTPLHTLFSSMPAYYYGYSQPLGKNVQIKIFSQDNSNIYTINSINYIQSYAEFSVCGLWQPIQSIVITTSMPIISNFVSPAKVITDAKLNNFGSNNLTINQLVDFQVPTEIGNEYKSGGNISYQSVKYRLVELKGNTPLSNVQLAFFWKSKFGILHQFLLEAGCCANIKLLFRLKSFNS